MLHPSTNSKIWISNSYLDLFLYIGRKMISNTIYPWANFYLMSHHFSTRGDVRIIQFTSFYWTLNLWRSLTKFWAIVSKMIQMKLAFNFVRLLLNTLNIPDELPYLTSRFKIKVCHLFRKLMYSIYTDDESFIYIMENLCTSNFQTLMN